MRTSINFDLCRDLPAMAVSDTVNEYLKKTNTLVVTAPPGAGKSTLLPLTILDGVEDGGRVIMLEPRRLAARQVAERMAFLSGSAAGGLVGYRVRFGNRVSAATRIEVITEGILSRMLVDDPTLEGVSVLIFDEFHERSLASDEALTLARETQRQLRPDLRIVLMSATMDTEAVCAALGAPLVESSGRTFPVTVSYSDVDSDLRSCASDVAREVLVAHRKHEGDILAFLPGEAEIRRCASLLEGELGDTHICPLYGMLPFGEQNMAIAASAPGERKVVLATSIAETSLTIEGVRIVVDSGLCRRQVFNPQTAQSRLETVSVSRDMADQRAGRAGRVAPGICCRLYRERSYRSMREARVPEILEADLLPLALDLAVWGCTDVASLPWLTPPPIWKIQQANTVLRSLEALDECGKVTSLGHRMASFPCHPRLAKMLCSSGDNGTDCALAADLAAIVEDRDPLPLEEYGADIDARVSALREARGRAVRSRKWDRTLKAAEQFNRMAGAVPDNSVADWYAEGRLLAAAFPERVGKASPDGCGRFLLASGDIVALDGNDPLASEDWIVAVSANVQQGNVGRVFLASRVRLSDLKAMAVPFDKVAWDNREGAVVSRREWRMGSLLLDSRPLADVPGARIVSVICEAACKYGTSMFDFSDAVLSLQHRVAAVASWHPELGLPDLSAAAVLARSAEWLPLWLGKASNVAELKRIDLCAALWGLLDYDMQQAVERLAPSHITVPTGSSIRVEYRQGADAPVLRVRLQECFGLIDTPRVDGGRLPVLMELLSPGFKPVQLTSDLASFWRDTYFEVRKELRRRYPRHSWPDNPLEAEAVRGVKKRNMRSLLIPFIFLLLPLTACAQKKAGSWLEVPEMTAKEMNSAYTVEMKVSGVKQRNYTFLWNESRMTADWVAYPLCRGNIGEGKRSNAFGLCPLLPRRRQPVLFSGYRQGNAGQYSRGHQIPSADRMEWEANVQTFYGVNMTPQNENLNGGIWSTLENKVRGWALHCDTLYVVTGCTYNGYKGAYALDNDGRRVAVPTEYFKALLMRKGNKFRACGFILENRPYKGGKISHSMAVPLDELEKRTHQRFFPGLERMAGKQAASRIRSEAADFDR